MTKTKSKKSNKKSGRKSSSKSTSSKSKGPNTTSRSSKKWVSFIISIILLVLIIFLSRNPEIKRTGVSLVNFFTEKCDWFGTLECKDLTVYSNGTLKLKLINPSLNLSSANLFLFNSQGENFSCEPISRWKSGTEKEVICKVPYGTIGEKTNLSFKFVYSPEDSPIYITETGYFITRYE
ncbi:MAG: hypothetical protein PWP03_68 [Candidatus Woesearchaeota archaeon]|nr:hypothetical protein [Candidatus Woesearchaeota archaeon]MDN5327430.1 hypothetical protein [Candidatus Woesearchaeota archaeon]